MWSESPGMRTGPSLSSQQHFLRASLYYTDDIIMTFKHKLACDLTNLYGLVSSSYVSH